MSPGNSNKGVVAVSERLGLDISHFAHKQSFRPVQGVAVPFANEIRPGGQSGLSIAARWFMDRGYVVSVPLEPVAYDLITESDDGLKKVQVKTTRKTEANGRYTVRVARNLHNGGTRKHVPYDPESVDYFFAVTPKNQYLIPVEVVGERTHLVLDEKYAAFAIECS